jgi:hypothetical protein
MRLTMQIIVFPIILSQIYIEIRQKQNTTQKILLVLVKLSRLRRCLDFSHFVQIWCLQLQRIRANSSDLFRCLFPLLWGRSPDPTINLARATETGFTFGVCDLVTSSPDPSPSLIKLRVSSTKQMLHVSLTEFLPHCTSVVGLRQRINYFFQTFFSCLL